jgi:shikimate kinase
VILVGMMGAGKSTVGAALSRRTGWPYVDNDELVLRATGVPTPQVLAQGDEQALRDAESAALQEALRTPPPAILSVAAGVVTREDDVQRLEHGDGFVVWLRAAIETLVARVGTGEGRAWLQPDPEAAFRRLYAGRPEKYAQVADLVVDVDHLSGEEAAERILAALPGTG